MADNLNYYGDLLSGGQGWSTDLSAFGAGGVQDAYGGGVAYDGTQGLGLDAINNKIGAAPVGDSIWNNGANGSFNGSTGYGMASLGVSALGTAAGAYLGYQQLGLAEDQFDFQKDSWEKQFAMMQDAYYRKLNNKRGTSAVFSLGEGATQEQRNNATAQYDSGVDQGAYTSPAGIGESAVPAASKLALPSPTTAALDQQSYNDNFSNLIANNPQTSGLMTDTQNIMDSYKTPAVSTSPDGTPDAPISAMPSIGGANPSLANTSVNEAGNVVKRKKKKKKATSQSQDSGETETETL